MKERGKNVREIGRKNERDGQRGREKEMRENERGERMKERAANKYL